MSGHRFLENSYVMLKKVSFAVSCLALALTACKKEYNQLEAESLATSSSSGLKNGGFRILPQSAARDPQRSRVIYRCNSVQCGEAFQPSNEERDQYFPCDIGQNLYPSGILPPFLRVVSSDGKQKLIVKAEHRQACQMAVPFEKLLSESSPMGESGSKVAGSACRAFRSNKEACVANEPQGCRWVTHPSGRKTGASGGDCVGLFKASSSQAGSENVQVLRLGSQESQWSPLESYRGTERAAGFGPK